MTLLSPYKANPFALVLAFIFMSGLAASAGRAGESSDDPEVKKPLKAPEIGIYLETGFEYTDNIFSLSKSQESTYNSDDSDNESNGRFKYMESLSDFIIRARAGLKLKKKFKGFGDFRFATWVRYNYYIRNEKCSYPEVRVKFEQEILKSGTIGIEGGFEYGLFKKNYLAAVNDADGDGYIGKSERDYSPAVYNQYESLLRYEYDFFRKKKKSKISSLVIEPFVGCRFRKFNQAFSNRNQNILTCGLGLNLGIASMINIETSYAYERMFCPGKDEIVLFDEKNHGLDVNDDGDLHNNALLITGIDRSCDRHTFGFLTSLNIRRTVTIFLGFKTRKTIYAAGNRLDIDRHGQDEDYRQIRDGIRLDFMKDLSATMEWTNTAEEDVDDGPSVENGFSVSVKYDFM